MVDTAKIESHRKLSFTTIDDALAEMDRILAADREGRLVQHGNWTAGQIFGHVAAWINYSYEGYPMGPPPFFIRLILRLLGRKYLKKGMPRGVRIPHVESGTFGTELLSAEEGAQRLRAAWQRLASGEPAQFDSPAFGAMSHGDRILLNLRHAELHFGFVSY